MKVNIWILVLICLLAVFCTPAAAYFNEGGFSVKTVEHSALSGGVYVEMIPTFPSLNPSVVFDVPDGNITWAHLYIGVWGGTPERTGVMEMTLNEHMYPTTYIGGVGDTNPNVYGAGYGVWFIVYNATDYTVSANNTATASISGAWDGRSYGIALVAAYENESMLYTEYWVNEGHETSSCTSYFNGDIDADDVEDAALWSLHFPDSWLSDLNRFNDHPLGSPDYALNWYSGNFRRWDELGSYVNSSDNSVFFDRAGDEYWHLELSVLTVEYRDKGVCGDVTGDDLVDTGDVILLSNYVGYPGYTLPNEWAGDVTGDGLIDTGDVILLSNYVGYPGYSLNCT